MHPNTLYFGDNLQVLREHFPDECVDLVYLDPPFNSKRDYNYIYRDLAGAGDTAQEQAFSDTWTFAGAAAEFREVTESGFPEGKLIDALHEVFGDTSLVAYLSVMALRLRELRRVLKPTGSLYLHCDPSSSHYLKAVLDAVMGAERYVNEITWQRTSAHSDAKQGSQHYGRNTDTILFYRKGQAGVWHPPYLPHDPAYVKSHYPHTEPGTGRRFGLWDITGPGGAAKGNPLYEVLGVTKYWRYSRERMAQKIEEGRVIQPSPGAVPREKRYLDETPGSPLGSNWTDIAPINSQATERLGYPTQKPLALLERIIAASSNEGDVVLDPFCGCGTAVVAAQKLGRQWCGIDITSLSVTLMRQRLADSFPEVYPSPGDVPVIGLPKDLAGARMLAGLDKYDFQFWALTLVGAHPPGGTKKKGADRGVDGEILWRDGEGKLQKAVVSVKGGHGVSDTQLKDLITTVDAEKAVVGLFISLAEPTKPMRNRAAQAGDYTMAGTTAKYPRIQMLTIEELLAGKRPDLPKSSRLDPHKSAKAVDDGGQMGLFEE